MNDEFENALAWFSAAPNRWLASAKKDLSAAAEWVWGVIQGDFNEDASTSQVVVGTVISMIPFVDQICDVRDVVANCKKINKEPDHVWHWVALCLTLIGLFPTLGSLAKGCGKVMFAKLRKVGYTSGATPEIAKAIEQAIVQLNKFLARPEVVKTLKALKIDNPYKYLAQQVRELSKKITVQQLLKAFDEARNAIATLLDLVKKWGGEALASKAGSLLKMVDEVRQLANKMLAKALKPLQDILDKLARRLDIEADMLHRAHLNQINPHAFTRPSSAAEKEAFDKALPSWVDKTEAKKYPDIKKAPLVPEGFPPLDKGATNKAHETFHTMETQVIPPGTTLYRVIDPKSSDNSICWMSKAEFDQLKIKDDWRRRFAVWANWNSNGEFVTYVVPPGKGLNVWEGVTASQRMEKTSYVLEGGARQIVVNPADLEKGMMGKRQLTNWGYGDFDQTTSLVGVPVLKNNWYESK